MSLNPCDLDVLASLVNENHITIAMLQYKHPKLKQHTRGQMSSIISKLVRDGFVTRGQGTRPARETTYTITTLGRLALR